MPIQNKKLGALSVIAILIMLGYLFFDGLVELEWRWSRHEEYSHGYMIPLVALFLLWQRVPVLIAADWKPAWMAPVIMLVALAGWCLGELSSLFIIVHYSLILALIALALAVSGWAGLFIVWAAIAYLVFMIPLPSFLYQGLSANLQLLSTELGVWFIRLFDISVYVAGNVIDLGVYQLQVVEACSGLTYLFPLMSFGFLIAYLYNGPLWHKWLIFLSAVPITIMMNSFRIAVIGITVKHWGVEMAEGFLHAFEGWFVFMACLGLLFAEVWLLNVFRSNKAPVAELLDFSFPSRADLANVKPGARATRGPIFATLLLLVVALPLSTVAKYRSEIVPERDSFAYFPLLKGDWLGRQSAIQPEVLDRLDLTDYIKAAYRRGSGNPSVDLYIAYYLSQRKGASIHSPRSCIPGGGWKISDLTQIQLGDVDGVGQFEVNRLVISKGERRQLVYYWFAQRGRILTNEYLAKWYLFWDALTMNRSDGALVRVVTQVTADEPIANADLRLQGFIRDFSADIERSIPGH